jgi:hypothetical protein
MSREFIPYEQAVELKKLGFDTPSISSEHGHVWEREILYQQAFRWLNEKLNIKGIMPTNDDEYRLQMLNNLIKMLSSKKKKHA